MSEMVCYVCEKIFDNDERRWYRVGCSQCGEPSPVQNAYFKVPDEKKFAICTPCHSKIRKDHDEDKVTLHSSIDVI